MNMLVRPAMNSGLTPTEVEQSIKSAYSKPRTARVEDEETVESCIQKMIHGTDEAREKAAMMGRNFRSLVSNVADVGTGDESRRCYLPAPKICELVQESNQGWPRTVNGMLSGRVTHRRKGNCRAHQRSGISPTRPPCLPTL